MKTADYYCFNVGAFGMNTMSDVMQKRIEQHVIEGILLTYAYQYNIIIVGTSVEHHKRQVELVLKKCLQTGIILRNVILTLRL